MEAVNNILVRIERYFMYPDIMRQTPQGKGVWGNVVFTEEKVPECDYLVILDNPGSDVNVKVNPDNIIHLCMEPPNEMSLYRQYGNKLNRHRFSSINTGKSSILSHGALPWHIDKSYDYLKKLNYIDLQKENRIAWITSNQIGTKGHVQRMEFLDRVKNINELDLFGRGIRQINDKWDALSKCKYGIAYENFSAPYYWTEKIIDCYLSYTMPIYIGNKKISNYFPSESFIQIDPTSDNIEEQIKKILKSELFEKNIESISMARNLILEKYQLFPLLHSFIMFNESSQGSQQKYIKTDINIKGGPDYFDNIPFYIKYQRWIRKLEKKIINIIKN